MEIENLSHFEPVDDSLSLFGKNIDSDWLSLKKIVEKEEPNCDIELIKKAYYFCVEKHSGVTRKSGLPYYTHPLEVTIVLLQEFPLHDTNSIIGALLHDTIEDCDDVDKPLLDELFNKKVGRIVEALSKIKHENIAKDKTENKAKNKALTYRKLFLALVKDVRVIIIKLADRIHNMRTMLYLPEKKRKEKALETLNFYVPFARRLGLNKIKMELENRSFDYSAHIQYEDIRSKLEAKRWDFMNYIDDFMHSIEKCLKEEKISHTISIVHKHEYEIYKMIQDGRNLNDIDNFYSLVIILNNAEGSQCYHAHGIIAAAFKTIQFIDEIASPTVDWFRSLKLDVMGPYGRRVEILIRTDEMEKIAEEGFASAYSLEKGQFNTLSLNEEEIKKWGGWMEMIIEEEGEEAAKIIWESIKVNIFDSGLSVYTKDGTEIILPQDSSIIDFSFAVNCELGLHTIAGKVNGKTENLFYKLKNGDQVEVIISQNISPDKDWLDNIVHFKSVVHLANYFKKNKHNLKKKKTNEELDKKQIIIKGGDSNNMANKITAAIGDTYIQRINIGASGAEFEGIVDLQINNEDEINDVFLRLFAIKGITSVLVKES